MTGANFLLLIDGLLVGFWMTVIFEKSVRDFVSWDNDNDFGPLAGFLTGMITIVCAVFTIVTFTVGVK